MNGTLRSTFILSVPLGIIMLALCWGNLPGDFWGTVEPPKAQCEAYHAGRLHAAATLTPEIYDQDKLNRLIREPQNTISNLPYLVAGWAIVLAGRKPASCGLGLAGMFLGFGSGMYHASLLPEWRMIDILGVYAVLYCLLLVGLATSVKRLAHGPGATVGVISVWAAAIYTGVHRNDIRFMGVKLFDSTHVFVAAVIIGGLLAVAAFFRSANRSAYLRAMIVFIIVTPVSFAGGIGDRFGGFWAAPEVFPQGHAVWHAFGALSLIALYEVFAAAGFDQSVLKPRESWHNGQASDRVSS